MCCLKPSRSTIVPNLPLRSMALTPFLAQFGGKLGQMLEKSDMKALQVGRVGG